MKSSSPKAESDYVAISYSDGGSKKFASWIATSMVDGKIPPARERELRALAGIMRLQYEDYVSQRYYGKSVQIPSDTGCYLTDAGWIDPYCGSYEVLLRLAGSRLLGVCCCLLLAEGQGQLKIGA